MKYADGLSRDSDNFDRLPRECASLHPTEETPILIKRGHEGYYPIHPATDVDRFNKERDITSAQIAAMEIGSMFGWDAPGADPLTHEEGS